MGQSRLSLAVQGGPDGPVALFGPPAGAEIPALINAEVTVVTGFRPDFDFWQGQGYTCTVYPETGFAGAVVYLPRAKALARALLHRALSVTGGGPVWVDGDKNNGIDSIWRECRKRGDITNVVTKNHGRAFCITAEPGLFSDWAFGESDPIAGGYVTVPGVFSADAPDPGSALLCQHLPQGLHGQGIDLGAGWGYLSAEILRAQPDITALHLVEAEHAALECARINLPDPRARFHWADATTFHHSEPVDFVVSNPPFHTGRAAVPELGMAFVMQAGALLRPGGKLWLVANRHLPYERTLQAVFSDVEQVADQGGYKVICASCAPRRKQS